MTFGSLFLCFALFVCLIYRISSRTLEKRVDYIVNLFIHMTSVQKENIVRTPDGAAKEIKTPNTEQESVFIT